MNVLLVDDRVPDPEFGAGFPRAYRLMLSLKQLGHTLHFYPTLRSSIDGLDLEALRNYGVHVWTDLDKGSPPRIDVAIMSRPHNVHYHLDKVKRLWPNCKVIYDTEALWFRRYDLQLSITGRLPGWAYRYDEIGMANRVDMCFVVNDEEKQILHANGVQKVIKLAHALDLHREGLPFSQRKDALVVGGCLEEDSSNEDALWTYLEGSWEDVRRRTGARLNVTGTVTSPRLKSHSFQNVSLMGHVGDLMPLYESHRIFVAATRFATGIPWKVHEAMAHGIPCVISRLLANQLKLGGDVAAMICDTPQEFVEKSHLLYEDEAVWKSMREKAFEYVADDCCVEKFKNVLREGLAEVLV